MVLISQFDGSFISEFLPELTLCESRRECRHSGAVPYFAYCLDSLCGRSLEFIDRLRIVQIKFCHAENNPVHIYTIVRICSLECSRHPLADEVTGLVVSDLMRASLQKIKFPDFIIPYGPLIGNGLCKTRIEFAILFKKVITTRHKPLLRSSVLLFIFHDEVQRCEQSAVRPGTAGPLRNIAGNRLGIRTEIPVFLVSKNNLAVVRGRPDILIIGFRRAFVV